MENNAAPAGRPGIERSFAYTVGVLLLVMVAALAGLSLRLYRRAVLAEAHAARGQAMLDEQRAAVALLGRHLLAAEPLDRRALPARPGRLDGQPITVLTASPEQAARIGLEGGDVLLVLPGATPTRPAGGAPDQGG